MSSRWICQGPIRCLLQEDHDFERAGGRGWGGRGHMYRIFKNSARQVSPAWYKKKFRRSFRFLSRLFSDSVIINLPPKPSEMTH